MEARKGQISLFVIAGIALIVGAVLYFSLNPVSSHLQTQNLRDNNVDTTAVQYFVEECLRLTAERGVPFISMRGAYYHLPSPYYEARPPTAFFVYRGNNLAPSLEGFSRELSSYIDHQLPYCLDDHHFPGREIEFGAPQSSSTIHESRIDIALTLPTAVRTSSDSFEIGTYHSTIRTDALHRAHLASTAISSHMGEDPDSLCLTCLYRAAESEGFRLFVDPLDENTFNIQLIDSRAQEGEEAYVFNFAANFGPP